MTEPPSLNIHNWRGLTDFERRLIRERCGDDPKFTEETLSQILDIVGDPYKVIDNLYYFEDRGKTTKSHYNETWSTHTYWVIRPLEKQIEIIKSRIAEEKRRFTRCVLGMLLKNPPKNPIAPEKLPLGPDPL